MASYVKIEKFVEHLMDKVHDLMGTAGSGADACKIALTNTAINAATMSVLADITEIAAGNGYSAGGSAVTNVGTRSGGTFTLSASAVTITASGGSVGPFRYVALYNDTPTSPADPLLAYWDHGSSVTLADGETFTWKPSNSATTGTVFTLA